MSNITVENVYIRQEAKELARKHRGALIGMFAIYFAISFGISMGGDLLLTLLTGDAAQTGYAYGIGNLVLQLISMLVTSGLMLGITCSAIGIARGAEHVRASDVFSRMSSCFKAFRLNLWVGLKTCLWALPSLALIWLLAAIASAAPDSEFAMTLLTILPFVLIIVMCALMIPAMYRYAMSTFILADEPETFVTECVQRSKAMMKGRKWQFFKLPIPFYLTVFGLYIALTIAVSLFIALFPNSSAAVLSLFLLYGVLFAILCLFMPRIYMCAALFYVKHAADSVIADESAVNVPAASTETADEPAATDDEPAPAPDAE